MADGVLYLVVRIGADRYAIEATQVVEVVSLVRLKALHGAPVGVAGVMNYRDEAIPVIDLHLLATRTAAARVTRNRIVIVDFTSEGQRGKLGLLVAEATETARFDPGAFTSPGISTAGASYLGPVLTSQSRIIQLVSVAELLSPELLSALFPAFVA